MKKIGIVSGKGELPCLLAREARRLGYYVVMIALDPIAGPMNGCADEVKRINVGKLGEIIKALKASGVQEAIMAGKVSKSLIYQGKITPDMRAVKLLFTLKDKKDDTILQAITDEIESEGIRMMRTTDFARDLLMPVGLLTRRKTTTAEDKDIAFGFGIAKEMGRVDIGQTVVVKGRAVMAVEAIEGTDEAIRRGGELAGGGAVVVKVSKPRQDMRYDVPVVGLDTLRVMIEVKASVLAVEAGSALIIQRQEMISTANDAGISIMGV
ncbi:UDP-2,3-diacylglucosamine pyrophosphatase [hydrothermal vent metagenome]|uniref:UDP-2,3-diacylglucosamine pyrophosphatase n=1 Tax=hydrothermal vent metagenome TaxID=652676 RepID=A0A3B1DJN2_9ZZZZ